MYCCGEGRLLFVIEGVRREGMLGVAVMVHGYVTVHVKGAKHMH